MTPELIGSLSVGAALAALMAGLAAWMRSDIRDVRADVRGLRADVSADIRGLRADVGNLDRRLARVEGVIEGMAYANGRERDRGEGRAA